MGKDKKGAKIKNFSRKAILSLAAFIAPFTLTDKVNAHIVPYEHTNSGWSQYVDNEGLDGGLDRHLKSNLATGMKNPLADYYLKAPYDFGEGDWINKQMYDLLDNKLYGFLEKTKYNLLGGWGNPWEHLYDAFGYNSDRIWDRSEKWIGVYTSFIRGPPYPGYGGSAGDWMDNSRIKWLDRKRYRWFDEKQFKFLGWHEYPFGPLYQVRVIPEPPTIVLLGLGALAILALRKRESK